MPLQRTGDLAHRPVGNGLHRIELQMGIALRRGGLGMSQHLAVKVQRASVGYGDAAKPCRKSCIRTSFCFAIARSLRRTRGILTSYKSDSLPRTAGNRTPRSRTFVRRLRVTAG